MHVSLYLNPDEGDELELLARERNASPSALAKLVVACALRDGRIAEIIGAERPRQSARKPWTDADIDYLYSRRGSGWSYGRIAHKLGRTRSSVIGKAARLGLHHDD